jgi:hypothetical protein
MNPKVPSFEPTQVRRSWAFIALLFALAMGLLYELSVWYLIGFALVGEGLAVLLRLMSAGVKRTRSR